jgi:phage terminase small subunit
MALTAKQEAFALAYLETGNASEAYRRAYNAEKMKPETVKNKAHLLLKRGDIRATIEILRKPVVQKAQITLESHLERLKQLSEKAEQEGQLSAAISAEVSRGKASGLYTEKIDHSSSDGSMTPAGLGHFYGSSTESGGDT